MGDLKLLEFIEPRLRKYLKNIFLTNDDIQEIRLRVDKPLEVILNNKYCFVDSASNIVNKNSEGIIVSSENINSCLSLMSNYSIYSIEDELRNGFITLKGGHRVGVTGKIVVENGYIKTMKNISGLNIRFAREIKGAADKVLPYLIKDNQVYHTLIVSPPQCGKTTLIRDLARQISNGIDKYNFKGLKVGIVDERSEIAGCYMGTPQNDVGIRTDVLDTCPKSYGIIMLIRAMSPDVIITDEIGTKEDISAVHQSLSAGIKIITTVHGEDLKDLKNKPLFCELIERGIFERIVILSNKSGVGTVEDILDGSSLKSIFYGSNAKCG